jgi:hypothetical protein
LRRQVRVDPEFFVDLDAQLGVTRGPNGEPSATDFLLLDLPPIAEAFALEFDQLPKLFDERDDYRYLVASGRLVRAALVVGQLVSDGSIELIGIEIDET